MRLSILFGSLLAVLLTVSPALAHHKPGHAGGPPWQRPNNTSNGDDQDGPPDDAPGNSGAAHWCKDHFNDSEHQFANHGQCVSFYAQRRHDQDAEQDDDEESETRAAGLNRGDLTIADVRARRDGTFRVRGFGAESTVQVWITGGSGLVVGFGQADPASDGTWTVEGRWACQDDHDSHDARFRAQDNNEVDSERATFPCDDLSV